MENPGGNYSTQVGENVGGNVASNPVVQVVQDEHQIRMFEHFLKRGPPEFTGVANPIQALEFLKKLEKIFTPMGIEGEMRVQFAAYRLQEGAYDWWETVQESWRAAGRGPILWEQFVELFKANFCLPTDMSALERELIELKQGDASVTDYEKRFSELCRMFPRVHATEQRRIERFRDGLNLEVRTRVSLFRYDAFHELINSARQVEREIEESRTGGEKRKRLEMTKVGGLSNTELQGRPFKRSQFNPSQYSAPVARPQYSTASAMPRTIDGPGGSRGNFQSRLETVVCYHCGKMGHKVADCRMRLDKVCFRCNQPGHTAINCPQSRGGRGYQGRGAGGSQSRERYFFILRGHKIYIV